MVACTISASKQQLQHLLNFFLNQNVDTIWWHIQSLTVKICIFFSFRKHFECIKVREGYDCKAELLMYHSEQSLCFDFFFFFSHWPSLFLMIMGINPLLITRITRTGNLNISYCLANCFPPMFTTQSVGMGFQNNAWKIKRN